MRQTWQLTTATLLLGLIGCGDGGGPNLHGPTTFTVTLDGAGWLPDTAVTLVYGSTCDTTAFISAVREVSDQEVEEVILIVHGFSATGQLALSDTSTPASAAFSVSQISGGFPTSTVTYWSRPETPGELTIVGATRDDSLITGRFAFEAAAIPDSGVHRRLTGHFRVRYSFQPVYTVPGC
jgi:hypothetical protein